MHAQSVRPKVSFISAIAAEPGVEPELYSSTPRRVTNTRETDQGRLWCANLIAGFLMVAFYCFNCGLFRDGIEKGVLVLLSILTAIAWLYSEGAKRRGEKLLRDGYAVRATVEKCELSEATVGEVDVRYYYTAMDGKQATGYLTLTTDAAKRVGGFEKGTTFTVLLHPTERYELLPYFQATGVEIPGAAPVRTMPPFGP